MNPYRNFLENVCNPLTGASFWRWVAMFGLSIPCAYLVSALPLIATMPDIGWIGRLTSDSQGNIVLVAYNGLFSFTGINYHRYFYWVIFGVAILWPGLLLWNIGDYYKDGFIFVRGNWFKK